MRTNFLTNQCDGGFLISLPLDFNRVAGSGWIRGAKKKPQKTGSAT